MSGAIYNTESIVDCPTKNKTHYEPGGKLTDIFLKSFGSLFKNHKSVHELFFSLIKKLNKFFSLSKAILVVHSAKDNTLKVIAMKGRRRSWQGLALSLPEKDSLLYKIFRGKKIYSQNYPDVFGGNFIEKKLLLDTDTCSIVICPIKSNGSIHGLLCLTSPMLYAFGMFEEGFLEGVLERFSGFIEKEIDRLHI